MNEEYFVYALYSKKDRGIYIGQTTNLTNRVKQHNYGKVRSTKSRRPLHLFHFQKCESRQEALIVEKEWKAAHKRRWLKKIHVKCGFPA